MNGVAFHEAVAVIIRGKMYAGAWDQMTHRRWTFTASFAVFVVESLEAIDAAAVFLHPFAEYFKQIGTFETHLADAAGETCLP